MADLLQQLLSQISAQSWVESFAVILALAYVWLAARQSIWCWPAALVSTGIYVWLFGEVSLPFHIILNLYYMFMAVYGWYQWRHQNAEHQAIQQWSIVRHLKYIIGLALITVVLVELVGSALDADYLYLDAAITVFSIFTTVLVAHKVLENWLYWMVINSAAAWLYFSKDLMLTGMLFVAYLGFAVYGYINWSKDARQANYA